MTDYNCFNFKNTFNLHCIERVFTCLSALTSVNINIKYSNVFILIVKVTCKHGKMSLHLCFFYKLPHCAYQLFCDVAVTFQGFPQFLQGFPKSIKI